jgi:hypothetical protein
MSAQQRVAHRSADQRELVTPRGEQPAEFVDDGRDAAQQFGDGAALGGGEVVRHGH